MRKQLLLLGFSFSFLLVGCQNNGPSEKELALQAKENSLATALKLFEGDFTSHITLTNSRKYDNPFNILNNISVEYHITTENDLVGDEFVRFNTTITALRSDETEVIELEGEKGVYNKVTGIVQDEFINYKNEVEFRNKFVENLSTSVSIEEYISKNIFVDLNVKDFTIDLDNEVINLDHTFLNTLLVKTLGYSSEIEHCTVTLENDQISGIDFKFKDLNNRFTNTGFEGDPFVESLEVSIVFDYNELTLEEREPSASPKKTDVEDVLAKFKANPTNYTIYYGPEVGAYPVKLLRDGERVAVDMSKLTDGAFDTLSFLDVRVEKNENGKYFVNNLTLDEQTEAPVFKTNYEIVDESINLDSNGDRLPEEQQTKLNEEDFLFDLEDFDLPFANLDSSMLTEVEGTYQVSGLDAKYFGEIFLSPLIDNSAFGIGTGMMLKQYSWTGTLWTLTVLDENTIEFKGECDLNWEGSSSKGYIAGKITDAGTTDASQIYTDTIPEDYI